MLGVHVGLQLEDQPCELWAGGAHKRTRASLGGARTGSKVDELPETWLGQYDGWNSALTRGLRGVTMISIQTHPQLLLLEEQLNAEVTHCAGEEHWGHLPSKHCLHVHLVAQDLMVFSKGV